MSKYAPARKTGRTKTQGTQTKNYSKYRKAQTKASIRATVRSEIIKAAEKKEFILYGQNITIPTTSGGTPAGEYLLPQISQGTDDGKRIGNKIKLVKGTLKGFVNIRPYDVTLNPNPLPVWVKIWLCRYTSFNTNALSATSSSTDFFQVSSGNVGFQGSMLDMVLPMNPDNWTMLDSRTFKLGVTNSLATGPTSTAGYLDNSDMAQQFMFDLTPHASTLIFNDTSITPLNNNLFVAFQVVRADGTPSFSVNPAEYHFTVDWKFIDV